MSLGNQNGRGRGDDQPLDDAVVEDLLAGRHEGDVVDLVIVSQFLAHVRSFGDQPVPPPSDALAQVLGSPAQLDGRTPATPGPWPVRDLRLGPIGSRVSAPSPWAAARRRVRSLSLPSAAAVAAGTLLAVTLAAGSARLLPGPAQDVAAKIVRTVTPFAFPAKSEPKHLPSHRPNAEAPAGAARPTGSDPSTSPGAPPGRDGDTQPGRPAEENTPPAPATTSTPRRSPSGAASEAPPPLGLRRPAPPPPPPSTFRAHLSRMTPAPVTGGPAGHGTALLKAMPGTNEVCLKLTMAGRASVISAHLHAGSFEADGPIVATFTGPADGSSMGCVTVPEQVVQGIQEEPHRYYVDVHSTDLQNGALRGQLTNHRPVVAEQAPPP